MSSIPGGRLRSMGLLALGIGLILVGVRGGSVPDAGAAAGVASQTVVVTLRPLAAGAVLRSSDVGDQSVPASGLWRAYPDHARAVVGQRLQVPLASGSVVSPAVLGNREGTPQHRLVTVDIPQAAISPISVNAIVDVVGSEGAGTRTLGACGVLDIAAQPQPSDHSTVLLDCDQQTALSVTGQELAGHALRLIGAG